MFTGKAILVVDDEPDLREILSDEFQMLGARVETAANGREALDKCLNENFDVVVSDLRMPGGDGVSLARALKEKSATNPVVVLMTGFADLTGEEAFELGTEGFVTKPFLLDQFRENLQRLLTPVDLRWQRGATKASLVLNSEASLYQGRSPKTYLGRGGIFVSGAGFQVRIGQEVAFRAAGLTGFGLVRWTRSSDEQGRGPGVGVEFLGLDRDSLAKVLQSLNDEKPSAYLPRGF